MGQIDKSYELIKLNQEHIGMCVYQTHIRNTRPMNLPNTPNQGMIQLPPSDHIKGGTPNTGISDHPVHASWMKRKEQPSLSQGL
jgi:hypothetical protein